MNKSVLWMERYIISPLSNEIALLTSETIKTNNEELLSALNRNC